MPRNIFTASTDNALIYAYTTDDDSVWEIHWYARRDHDFDAIINISDAWKTRWSPQIEYDVDTTKNIEILTYAINESMLFKMRDAIQRIDAKAKEMTQ